MLRVLIFFFLITSVFTKAQNDLGRSYNMFWGGYYNYVRLSSKWNINSDIQHRTKDGFKTNSTSLIRTGAVYKINKSLNITTGIAHFRYYLTNISTRGEWRPWQEFSASTEYGQLKISNRFRSEERYNQVVNNGEITSAYKFNMRYRYRVDLEFPLWKQNELSHTIGLGNEFMLNSGKGITNPFDQNRTFVSFNYQLFKNLKLQFQYLFIVQYQSSLKSYDKISVLRFNIHHTI